MDVADITMVGSGLATTVTLIELFDKLLNKAPGAQKLTITVIEKNRELWLGIPYGSRSSVNALSITCVYDFIYEPERPAFFKWLKANKDDWAAYYQQQGGVTAARWLEKNLPLIEKEDWETVYIPRFLFGKYFLEKFTGLLKAVQEKQLVEIKLKQGEAVDIKIVDGGDYEIIYECPDQSVSSIVSPKVVVAIGSPPIRRMYENDNNEIVYINDIYEPSVSRNIETLRRALSKIDEQEDRNVLVIGSNASSIELLYLLEGIHDVRKLINKTIVISPSGALPYHISVAVIEEHATPGLDKLATEGNYTLESVIAAASADIKLAVEDGANVAYIATIINNTLKHLEVLGEEAKKAFLGIYGMQLSNMFRRAGPEYKNGSQSLIDEQEATLLKGKFLNAEPLEKGVLLNYLDMETGLRQTYPLRFNAIINCSGSEYLEQSSSRLIRNLAGRNICGVNLSGKGFEVNERFEAAPNLYIMGPLLGGNMNKLIHFWHLENAPRLMYLAPYLADVLLDG